MGSPPRVRGKAGHTARLPCTIRITPACAGKSFALLVGVVSSKDHPRVCGEKDVLPSDQHLDGGITPACAGKRVALNAVWSSTKDHPRVCGEKILHYCVFRGEGGSPPRVRGKAFCLCAHNRLPGITPACAGKSIVLKCARAYYWDHPRVCGEKNVAVSRSMRHIGSPPRVRGKVGKTKVPFPKCGITPACAGKRMCLL